MRQLLLSVSIQDALAAFWSRDPSRRALPSSPSRPLLTPLFESAQAMSTIERLRVNALIRIVIQTDRAKRTMRMTSFKSYREAGSPSRRPTDRPSERASRRRGREGGASSRCEGERARELDEEKVHELEQPVSLLPHILVSFRKGRASL